MDNRYITTEHISSYIILSSANIVTLKTNEFPSALRIFSLIRNVNSSRWIRIILLRIGIIWGNKNLNVVSEYANSCLTSIDKTKDYSRGFNTCFCRFFKKYIVWEYSIKVMSFAIYAEFSQGICILNKSIPNM